MEFDGGTIFTWVRVVSPFLYGDCGNSHARTQTSGRIQIAVKAVLLSIWLLTGPTTKHTLGPAIQMAMRSYTLSERETDMSECVYVRPECGEE